MKLFLYLTFSIVLTISIFMRKRRPFVDSRFMVEVGLLVYYGIAGMRYVAPGLIGATSRYIIRYGVKSDDYLAFFCIVLYYLFFLFGNKYIFKVSSFSSFSFKRGRDYSLYDDIVFAKKMALLIVVISGLLFLMYANSYGGIRVLMISIAAIRGGEITAGGDGVFGFITKLFKCAPFAIYFLWNYDEGVSIKTKRAAVFICSLIIVISSGSRGAILTFLLILILGRFIEKTDIHNKRFRMSSLVLIGMIVVFSLVLYRPLLTAVYTYREDGIVSMFNGFIYTLDHSNRYNASSISGIFSSIFQSTDHYIYSLENAISHVNNGAYVPRYFLEPIVDVLNVLPSKLLGISKATTITAINSAFITENTNDIVQVPAGIVGEAYYAGGIGFVPLYGLVMGIVGRRIDDCYQCAKAKIGFMPTYYMALLFVFFNFAIGGDWASQFGKHFTSLIIIFYVNYKIRSETRVETSDIIGEIRIQGEI